MDARKCIAFFLILSLMGLGCAGPVYNPPSISVPGNKNAAQVRQIILNTLKQKGWTVEKDWQNLIQAGYHLKRLYASVNIRYNSSAVDVSYKDSRNLKYQIKEGGQAVIHRRYNSWARNLENELQLALAGVARVSTPSRPPIGGSSGAVRSTTSVESGASKSNKESSTSTSSGAKPARKTPNGSSSSASGIETPKEKSDSSAPQKKTGEENVTLDDVYY